VPLDPHRNWHPESDADHHETVKAAKQEAKRRGWDQDGSAGIGRDI
jgi:hypothetical protein